jgi:hypothetical protein
MEMIEVENNNEEETTMLIRTMERKRRCCYCHQDTGRVQGAGRHDWGRPEKLFHQGVISNICRTSPLRYGPRTFLRVVSLCTGGRLLGLELGGPICKGYEEVHSQSPQRRSLKQGRPYEEPFHPLQHVMRAGLRESSRTRMRYVFPKPSAI